MFIFLIMMLREIIPLFNHLPLPSFPGTWYVYEQLHELRQLKNSRFAVSLLWLCCKRRFSCALFSDKVMGGSLGQEALLALNGLELSCTSPCTLQFLESSQGS